MRSLAKKILPVIALFAVGCGGDSGSPFSDDPVGVAPGVLCPKGSLVGWRDWITYYYPAPGSASWAAIQRENQPWQSIDATQANVPLNPGEKIGLARWLPSFSPHSGPTLEIFFVTAEQAQTAFPCVSASTKSLQGTAQGLNDASLPGNQGGYLAIGNSSTDLTNGPFTLDGVLPGHTDLVATRLDAPPKTIIRRGIDYPSGAAIPVLNFGSSEAIWSEPHTFTVNGANIIQLTATNQIATQQGTIGLISRDFAREGTTTRTLTMYSVPERNLTSGEVQFFSADAEDYRKAMVMYRHPTDRTVTLGPDPSVATATHLGTAPNQSLRLDMASQPEYGAQVTFNLCSPVAGPYSTGTGVSLLVTKEYFGGTPATWSIDVPDFTSVQGFPGNDFRAYNLCSMSSLTNLPFVFAPRATHDGDVFYSLEYGSNVLNK